MSVEPSTAHQPEQDPPLGQDTAALEPIGADADAGGAENSNNNKVLPKFETNRELLFFLLILIKENKKWWLIPWFLILAILSIFVSLTGNTSILPAIYAFF